MNHRIVFTLIYALFLTIFSKGQAPHFVAKDYPGAEITLIHQDSKGFIWVGSKEGLYRFDGIEFRLYLSGDSAHVDHVRSMLEVDDQYWIGYENGRIYHLDPQQKLKLWQLEEGLPAVPITGIIKDSLHRTWIATYGEGLYVLSDDILYNLNEDDGLIDNEIYDIALDRNGEIWIATDNGINICQFRDQHKSIKHLSRADGLLDEIVYVLKPDADGMWIGFDDGGVIHYNQSLNAVDNQTDGWIFGSMRDLQVVDTCEVWLTTENSGLLRFDCKNSTVTKIANNIAGVGDRTGQMLMDNEQNIWLAVSEDKLISGSRNIEILEHNLGDIQTVFQDNSGRLWAGTQIGLYQLINGKLKKDIGRDLNIISLYEDHFNNLWIGTFGEGVFVWDSSHEHIKHFDENDGLSNGSVLSIAGHQDRLWLATLGGITEVHNEHNIFSGTSFKHVNLNSIGGLNASFIYKIFVDNQGVVWVATDGSGVLKIENEVAINLLQQGLLPARTAYCFAQDSFNNLWIGSAGDGLFRYHKRTYQKYDESDGLSTMSILGLEVDKNGRILVVHSKGIDVLDPASGIVNRLGENSGLEGINPPLNSTFQTQSGNIWIGGQNMMIRYRPFLSKYPRIVLDDVRVFDQSIDFSNRNQFANNDNFIQFNSHGIWYAEPEAVSYYYQLEGNDLQWRISADNSISYSKLAPGEYTFHVKPALQRQPIDSAEVTYRFKIWPPYWQRPWFIGLMILGVMAILYFYQRYREVQINREANIERERVESQFELLKAQINPHFLFNSFNALANIVEEDSNLAVEYIEKLSDYYRSITQYRNQKVIALDEEISVIKDYFYLLKKRFGSNLKLELNVKKQDGFVPPLSVQMLVENAIKHNVISKKNPLRLKISRKGDYVAVENNFQPKLTKPPSTNFGIQNIKNQFHLLTDRKVRIDKTADHFIVEIPVIKNQL